MKTYENSQGQTFNTQAEAAASNTALGTNPSSSSYKITDLTKSNPVVTPTTNTSATDAMSGISESLLNTTNQQTQAELDAKNAENTTKANVNDILSTLGEIGNVSGSANYLEADAAKKQSDEYTA